MRADLQCTQTQDLIDRAIPLYPDQGIRFDNQHNTYDTWDREQLANTRLQYRQDMQQEFEYEIPKYPPWNRKPNQETDPYFAEIGNNAQGSAHNKEQPELGNQGMPSPPPEPTGHPYYRCPNENGGQGRKCREWRKGWKWRISK